MLRRAGRPATTVAPTEARTPPPREATPAELEARAAEPEVEGSRATEAPAEADTPASVVRRAE